MSDTYARVDAGADPAGAADWQERMAGWPAVAAYKRRTYELLGDGTPVVDVGAGPGADLLALGRRAVGVDGSWTMAARARSRGTVVCRADALRLPFPAGAVAGARSDRVVQHLADPAAGVAELARVVRPGGRVVVSDPDQESLVIHVPGVPDELVARVKACRRDVGYRNGGFARRLPAELADAGLADVTVEAFPLVLTDPADAFGLPGWPRYWAGKGLAFSPGDVAVWEAALGGPPPAGFLYALTVFVVSGRR